PGDGDELSGYGSGFSLYRHAEMAARVHSAKQISCAIRRFSGFVTLVSTFRSHVTVQSASKRRRHSSRDTFPFEAAVVVVGAGAGGVAAALAVAVVLGVGSGGGATCVGALSGVGAASPLFEQATLVSASATTVPQPFKFIIPVPPISCARFCASAER